MIHHEFNCLVSCFRQTCRSLTSNGCIHNSSDVNSWASVENSPHDTREEEKYSLAQENHGNPLIVANLVAGFVRLWYPFRVEGQIVRVADPADFIRILFMWFGELSWYPAVNRFSNVLFRAHLQLGYVKIISCVPGEISWWKRKTSYLLKFVKYFEIHYCVVQT